MGQYIDKSALIAEIKRKLKNINLNYVSAGSHPSDFDVNKKLQDGISKNLQSLLSFINTLEVKEVDLEEEMRKWQQKHFEGIGYVLDGSGGWIGRTSLIDIAEHFFELGLKASQ